MSLPSDHQARITALKEAHAAIARELEILGAAIDARPVSTPVEWVSLAAAAYRCARHRDSMAKIVRQFGLGRRVGRAWLVDMVRVNAWMQNLSYTPIPTEISDITTHHDTSSDVPDEEPPYLCDHEQRS